MCLTASVLMLALGGWWILAERRFQAGLRLAKAEMDSGRFEAAARRLTAHSAWSPKHAETAFLLGVCASAAGRLEEALAAWARVPLQSQFGVNAALAQAQTLVSDFSRFADAETIITRALSQNGLRAPRLRYLLNQLFYWQGRVDEMRQLLQEG
jgi:tetratricopeptide (TPR) repeat protein